MISSTNVRISNVRKIPDRILSFVRVREARDDIRQNFNPNLKIKLYEKTLRIAHRYSIDRLLFPQNLRESSYRLKATKIFFQSLLIIGPFRLVYHPICTIGRRYIMIISHLSSLNRINVNTSTRITEPVSARDDVSVASAEGLTGIILCAGYRREHSPPFGHHDARNVLDDRCGRDRRQLVMRRSRLSARRWLRSPPICRFSDPDRVLCDPFSSPFSFFSAPCRSAAPSTWVSLNF